MIIQDILNPWKDIAAYNISDAYRFKGREKDIEKFLRIVKTGTMSVLYANSGIGKTSFINAGIIPTMLKEGYFPIHILFPDDVLQNDQIETWLFQELLNRVNKNEIGRVNDFCWKETVKEDHETWKQSLWWLLNTCYIYQSSTGRTFKPLIIFDQFEEVFTKSNKVKKTNILENLFRLIGQLCSTSFPKDIEQALDNLYANGKHIELSNTKQYKVIFSLRKEYLSDFDYWTNDKNTVTELHQNRLFLLPLTRLQAEEVISRQPLSEDNPQFVETLNPIKDKIIDLIDSKHKDEVEPFILSILCSNLYNKAKDEGKEFLMEKDVELNAESLILNFYEENANQIFINKSHLNRFEECLVDSDGQRNRIKTKALDGILFEQNYQEALEKLHLIRIDKYNDENYVELIHDRIADAIKERRRISKQKKQARGWNWFWFLIIVLLAFWAARVITSSPSKSSNYFVDICEYTNLSLTSDDTLAFMEKGRLENSHMVEQLRISDTTVVTINNCSYLKELILELPKGEQKISLIISDCPQLRTVIIPDTVKELSYCVNNCPGLKLPVSPGVEKLNIKTDDSDCSFSFAVNNNNYSWEEAVPYQSNQSKAQAQSARRDSTKKHNYTLWDKRDGRLLYAQCNVPEVIYFPQYHSDNNYIIWYGEKIGGRLIKNASNSNAVDKNNQSQYDTINVRNVHTEDVTNVDAEYIYLTDDVEYISPSAFKKCKKLKSIRFSPNIRTIYEKAFQGCVQLDSIILPDSLKYMCEYAFEGCENLHYIYLGNAKSLYLCEGVFANCKNLETIELTGNIESYYNQWEGNQYFINPFYNCPKLNNIILKNPDTSNLFIKGNIAFAKHDSIPVFITGSRCDYHNNNFYSNEGSLFRKVGNGTDKIWFLADSKHLHLSKEFYFENNIVYRIIHFDDNSRESYIVNHIVSKELFLPPLIGRGTIHFVHLPDSLRTIHIPFSQPANHIYSLSFDMPDSLAQNVEIVVPHGCSKYYINNPNFNGFKSIREESYWCSQWNAIKFNYEGTKYFFSRHWWGLPAIIVGCLILGITIYYSRKKYLHKRNVDIKNSELLSFTVTEILLAILLYTIFYWILSGYYPGSNVSNNIIAVPMTILTSLVIMIGRNDFLAYLGKLHSFILAKVHQITGKKDMLFMTLHTDTGKEKLREITRRTIILFSVFFTFVVVVLVLIQINDIDTMLVRKDYQRAFALIYRQAIRTDSISKPIQEVMRKILIEKRSVPGLPDSISISGENVIVDNDNEVVYITRSDSVFTFDIRNKKRYVTPEKYNLSKLGKVFYKDNGINKVFIPVNNQKKVFTTNVKTDDWRLMCAERFVVMKTDTLLYIYDLENNFACRNISFKSAYMVWGEGENDKYFAVRDPFGETRIYIMPDFEELHYDKPSIVCGFTNNQIISYEPDWEKGQTYLMNIDKFFETTASYHGIYSCLSFDQKSFLFTTDHLNIYWWSLKENDSSKGFLPRSIFKLNDKTTFSSQRFAVLRNANKLALNFLKDYNIPTEFGFPIGETNNCLVFNDENAHVTRIFNMEKPNEEPVVIKKAWPTMINFGKKAYLQICNSANKWQSDSTSIYNGQNRIITNHYIRLNVTSDYAISGDYDEKSFYPLNDNSKMPHTIKLEGNLPKDLSIMDGWLFATWGKNLKVYNFLTLEDLIQDCNFYSVEQKEKIIGILRSPSKNE